MFLFNEGNNADAVKTSLDFILKSEYDYGSGPGFADARNPVLFKQKKASNSAVRTAEFMGPGTWDQHEEEEELTIATVRTFNVVERAILKYNKTLKFSQELEEDDMHGIVEDAIRRVGHTGRETDDKDALNIYVDGFNTTFTTNDAAALWSNSHTSGAGRTIDNLETGAMSPANLETLVRSLYEQRAQDDSLGNHLPVALLVPPILFPDAQEITKSELMANTANNNLNYWSHVYPTLQIFQSAWVAAAYNTSNANANTSYYVVGRNHSICRAERVPMSTKLVPPDNDDFDRWTYKARYRVRHFPISWEAAVASNGTA